MLHDHRNVKESSILAHSIDALEGDTPTPEELLPELLAYRDQPGLLRRVYWHISNGITAKPCDPTKRLKKTMQLLEELKHELLKCSRKENNDQKNFLNNSNLSQYTKNNLPKKSSFEDEPMKNDQQRLPQALRHRIS
jgi:GH24 family phage-related lysozyme (muramidase)